MVLSDVSINRPVFITMVIVALMTLGGLAFRNLGVDQFPDVDFPVVVVNTVYPGAGPEEIETQVTKPVEEALSSLNGIDTVRSISRDSISTVILQFKLEVDIKAASADVRDRMGAIRYKLPDDIEDPTIMRFDPASLPILTYVVSSGRHPAETRRLTEDVLKPRLEAVSGVASVSVLGGLEREIKVYLDRERLNALNIPIAAVAQQLATEGFDLPAGRVTTAGTELNLKTEGRFKSLEELENVVVSSFVNGAQVRLRDVARVEDGFKDVRTRTRLDGADAVTFEVQKQSGTNTVEVTDGVLEAIAKLEKTLPPDVKLLKAIDGSVNIRQNIHAVTEDIIVGGLAAILIVFLFMMDWRSTLITSLSLPTSVVTTFLFMWWLGFTFNMMSLLALSLSIGLLIDDAVVVRENIFRHMEMGKDPITAAREGTNEIGLAVMATTFTIVAVFVPVAFMGGIVGQMFRQFGLTVAAAVLVSLFISFTLDPMMSARVMKPVEPGHEDEKRHHKVFGPMLRFYERMDAGYRGLLAWSLGHQKSVVGISILLFVGSLGLAGVMPKEFMSAQDRGEFMVKLELPAGASLQETDRVTTEVERAIREASPHVQSIFTTLGPSEEANKASLRVYTTKKQERPGVPQTAIQDTIRERLAQFPNLLTAVTDVALMGPDEQPVSLRIRGEDYDAMIAYANVIVDKLKRIPGAKDADSNYRGGKPESAVRVDRNQAADLGVAMASIAQTVRLAYEGQVVAKFRAGDREVDIRTQLPPEERADVAKVGELYVMGTKARAGGVPGMPMMMPGLVPVGQIAKVEETTGPAIIEREGRQRQITVGANLSGRTLGEVMGDLEEAMKDVPVPPGVQLLPGGQAENMAETFANMALALAVAIIFIYFVLASQFESFIHPFTIMVSLPLAFVGAFLALFLADMAIGMPALIGLILLMGLVTKNAILLVDYTNELRERGMNIRDALLAAGPTRLRPILMTSAAMVLGMLPPALSTSEGSEFKSPMATGVIGGVIASTILTLVVVPIVYTWFDRLTPRGRAERRAAAEANAQARPAAGEEGDAAFPAPAAASTMLPES